MTNQLQRLSLTGKAIPRCLCGKAEYADNKCYGCYQSSRAGVPLASDLSFQVTQKRRTERDAPPVTTGTAYPAILHRFDPARMPETVRESTATMLRSVK